MLNTMNYDIDITKEPPAGDTAPSVLFYRKSKSLCTARIRRTGTSADILCHNIRLSDERP